MPDANPPTNPLEIGYVNRSLVETAALFSQTFQRWLSALAAEGRSYPELRLIEDLHCHGPAKMRALADGLGLSARNMTAIADTLAAEGLVRRAAHPTDRRVTLLELTPAGVLAAEKSLAPRLERIGRLFDCLSATQRDLLDEPLRALTNEMVRTLSSASQDDSKPTL